MPDATDIAITREPQLLALKRQDSERAARLCRNRANIRWPQSTSAAHAPAPATAIGQLAGNSHRGPRGASLRSQARRAPLRSDFGRWSGTAAQLGLPPADLAKLTATVTATTATSPG
jgi:hypothetical protein